MTRPIEHRFISKISIGHPSGCWLWQAHINYLGYGAMRKDSQMVGAHRVSYEIFKGPIPHGHEIDHLCRVRNCVNPNHLEAVTKRENISRSEGVSVQNARKTFCKYGHELTEENVYHRKDGRQCKICRRQTDLNRRKDREAVNAYSRKMYRLRKMKRSEASYNKAEMGIR
jgi:hypothetical protein